MLLRSRSRRSLLPIAYFLRPVVMVVGCHGENRFPLNACFARVFSAQERQLSPVFFTVKHIFLKIKVVAGQSRPIDRGEETNEIAIARFDWPALWRWL